MILSGKGAGVIDMTFGQLQKRIRVAGACALSLGVVLFFAIVFLGWNRVVTTTSPWAIVAGMCVATFLVFVLLLRYHSRFLDVWQASTPCRRKVVDEARHLGGFPAHVYVVLECLLAQPGVSFQDGFSHEEVRLAAQAASRTIGGASFSHGLEMLAERGILNVEDGIFSFSMEFVNNLPEPPSDFTIR